MKELTELVLERLRGHGTIRAEDAVLDANPSVRGELASIFASSNGATVTTDDALRLTGESGGLSIRCPHCHGAIPLVVDSSLMEILCDNCGGTFSLVNDIETTRDAAVLSKVAHFEIIERLGMGEFGTVWKARDTLLDRTVALKIPRREQLDPLLVEKFMREARAAAQLRHPNIVSTHEVGREGNTLYIVIDYVRGVPLSVILDDHRLGIRESVEMLAKIAAALEHAHRAGVIHRDLKPSNILVDENGEPHLMDFGLAKRKELEISITTDGAILGTPAYMSPEQARGEANRVDGRSDVYSAGVLLFQMLTGELPFRGSTRMLLQKVINDDAPGPRTLEIRVPRDLDTICLKCLEKEPARRYATAGDLAADFHRFLAGQPVSAHRVGRWGRTLRWARRNPVIAALLVATATTLLLATAISTYFATQAAHSLGESLMQEIRLTREVHRQGYGETVRKLVKEVRDLPFASVNDDDLRRQVTLTLGDVAAYSPRAINSAGGPWGTTCLSENGEELYVGKGAGELVVYDIDTGNELASAKLMDDSIAAIAVGEQRDRVFVADYHGKVQQWQRDGRKFKRLQTLELNKKLQAVVFSPRGELVAFLKGATLDVWNVAAGEKLHTLPAKPDWSMQSAVFDLPRHTLTAGFVNEKGNSSGWASWDLKSGEQTDAVELPELGGTYINDIDRNSTGGRIAVGFDLGLVLYDAARHERIDLPTMDSTTAVAFNPATPCLAAANIRGSITLWNLVTNRPLTTLYLSTPKASPTRLMFSADGGRLIAANASAIQIWDLHKVDEITIMQGHQGAIPCAAFHPSGKLLATGGKDNFVRFWNPATGQQVAVHDFQEPVQTLTFSPDGRLLAIGCMGRPGAPHLRMMNVDSKAVLFEESPAMGEVYSLHWSECGGERFLAGSGLHGVALWRVSGSTPPKLDAALEIPSYRCLATVFDCKSSSLIWAEENRIKAWDVATGQEIVSRATEMNQGWNGLTLLPDGESILYISSKGIAETWRIRGNQPVSSFAEPGTHILPPVALSNDGKWFAALTQFDNVSIWYRPTGQHVFSLRVAPAAVWSLAWDHSGEHLAVGQSDGALAVWHIPKIQEQLAELGLKWRESE